METGETLGVAAFVISVGLAALRVFEFFDARVRLKADVGTTQCASPPEWEGADECYELQVTNMGTRATTITWIQVRPYERRKFGPKRVSSSGEDFVSGEGGLGYVKLGPGDTYKWTFPLWQLSWRFGYDAGDDEGRKVVDARGQMAFIHHKAAWWPKKVDMR